MAEDTRDEIRDTKEGELTPAMRRWVAKLRAGYTIRPALRMGRDGYLTWGPALYNPDGAFVQNVRRDMTQKLWRLGYLGDERKHEEPDRD